MLGSDTNLTQSNPNILISPNLAMKLNNSGGSMMDQPPPASNPAGVVAPAVNSAKAVKDQVRKLVEY